MQRDIDREFTSAFKLRIIGDTTIHNFRKFCDDLMDNAKRFLDLDRPRSRDRDPDLLRQQICFPNGNNHLHRHNYRPRRQLNMHNDRDRHSASAVELHVIGDTGVHRLRRLCYTVLDFSKCLRDLDRSGDRDRDPDIQRKPFGLSDGNDHLHRHDHRIGRK